MEKWGYIFQMNCCSHNFMPKMMAGRHAPSPSVGEDYLSRLYTATFIWRVSLYLQVSSSKFHELRYNVAYVLKEMEDVEKKNILKIQD